MPIYEYQCSTCGAVREVFAKIPGPDETACGECGGSGRKVVSAPAAPRTNLLSDTNLAEKGFTKYKRAGKGNYEKVAGKGPAAIRKG